MANGVTNTEAREALQACENGLADAFEASNDIGEKTTIFKAMRAVHQEIISAVQAELRDANGAYRVMTQEIRNSLDDLKSIQVRINSIIVNTKRAADAVAAIAQVVSIVAKFVV